MYPEIEPHEHGFLEVGDGHRVYWEVCGNPAGLPAVVLHGGPGSGCTPSWRQYLDPARYRIVLFDQRGCGRSTPHAGESESALRANTTAHLLADIEALRELLGVRRWLVFGASWGCVLGLRYAQTFPERVAAAVFFALATGSRAETDLLTHGLGPVFPEAWQRFSAGLDGDLSAAYHRLLTDPDPEVCAEAARRWCAWEDAIVPTSPPSPRFRDPRFRLGFARLVTHYWANGSFLADGIALREAGKLAGIPAVLVQGTMDLSNLLGTPWLLHQAWPGSELVMIEHAGHGSGGGMAAALVAATDRFAG
ncbi:prolyl aminopeptidase [Crossiella cryophila]|uniref:Proline iminopeptidase n=1 Tax=Crossiella cryophila TaxID=43355 RepID=A0A7W7CDQ7_9PSEU|nr:prolyl aminopeptidase [Crossiella cryophila]MBB4679302.1 proline iminopeptidase [Crossiella cryophila]